MGVAKDDCAPVLVTGATGYIGGRLVPRLLEKGVHVRVAVRTPSKLRGRSWAKDKRLEVVQADVFDLESLQKAAQGCRAAYYLVHSMNPQAKDFAQADRIAAGNMAKAAADAALAQIIYLSGLGDENSDLSPHLRSRAEVARVLREGPVPVTVLRAAMIIGSGSASFEILRYLVDRLPVMITPRWVDTPCQPIAVRNVLNYLVGCLEIPGASGETFDIGQPEIVTYRRLMEIYAEEAGLHRRWVVPVPVLTPRLSSYWIHLVTPVPASIARPLAEGLRNEVVCRDHRIRELIPQELLDCRTAIRLALENSQRRMESRWTGAGQTPPVEWALEHDPQWAGGTVFEDQRRVSVHASPEQVWRATLQSESSSGWLWRLRGFADRLIGGVGSGRSGQAVDEVHPGDAVDFWRVVNAEPPSRLLLLAEMKLPGSATLEYAVRDVGHGETEVRQILRFMPRGLAGILYWYLVAPLHGAAFGGKIKAIAEQAQKNAVQGDDTP
jgi:uncharacterized protein YbjT (DUF2867 family)